MRKKTVERIKQIINPPSVLPGRAKGEKMKSDLNYIKKLIKLLNSNDVSEIEVEEDGVKVRVVKHSQSSQPQIVTYAPPAQTVSKESPKEESQKKETKSESKSPKTTLIDVRSPIVGTFYRAPSPNADPYVQVGQTVGVGTILCIIEAMKLMNEIECEVNGKIVEISVENGKPVEYNQLLFRIEPS